EVPVVIALNWVLVAHGAWALARRLVPRSFAAVPAAAAIATAFDWIMEPVAIRLGYWTWDGVDIPLQNYAAWFVISFAATFARHFIDRRSGARASGAFVAGTGDLLAFAYLVVQAAFFALLRLGWAFLPGY
ncbi:MAG: carotenoid biosynthesis protein, partial [Spirochaetales bacterium]|nr:carotenoid biosynthesis protein [Spirochaetales bacterium]